MIAQELNYLFSMDLVGLPLALQFSPQGISQALSIFTPRCAFLFEPSQTGIANVLLRMLLLQASLNDTLCSPFSLRNLLHASQNQCCSGRPPVCCREERMPSNSSANLSQLATHLDSATMSLFAMLPLVSVDKYSVDQQSDLLLQIKW